MTGNRLLLRLVLLVLACTSAWADADDSGAGGAVQQQIAPLDTGGMPSVAAGPATIANTLAPELSPDDAREDLTVFFVIGIVIDLLLLALFFWWAIGQWRKSRK